jgi:asparagine synthase (glutamine-hydrolysing)
MCGIAGGTFVSPGAVEAAIERIGHRGPDARGCWRSPGGGAGLGHARLAIIDLDPSANQPMVCPRTGNVLVFNGEIYNYVELRGTLARAGWEFSTRSDTEVLLAAYGQWGAGCLRRLNGMFAFAVYDPALRRVFLARDRVGKKPLYYSLWGGELAWASEVKALLALRPGLPREPDPEALKEYMGLGYIPGSLSIYRHVRKLPPAHCASYVLDDGVLSTDCYWRLPPPAEEAPDEDEAAERLEALLVDAVRLRLQSDVPVGVFLSGGLDSSLVTAVAARSAPGLTAYTAKFPVARFDESALAARVAAWTGVSHRILPVDAGEGRLLEELFAQFDEPFADSSLLPTYLVSRAIREHVKVALSGDGGDELFAGYGYYDLAFRESVLDAVPAPLRRLASRAHRLLPPGTRGRNFLRRLPLDPVGRYLLSTSEGETAPAGLLREPLGRVLGLLPDDGYRRALRAGLRGGNGGQPLSPLQEMTRLDFLCYLPDDVLVKVDRASMRCSLEVRSPLLDYRIVELAFSLPDALRRKGGAGKRLLVKVARRYLPPDFPYHRKQGFSIPEGEWFKGAWRDRPAPPGKRSLLGPDGVEAARRLHDRTGRYGPLLFRIAALQGFERIYGVTGHGE